MSDSRWRISEEDAALFREHVGDVRRLATDTAPRQAPPPSPRARFRRADEARVLADSLTDAIDPVDVGHGGSLFFVRPGVDRRVMKRLRRGQYAIGGECDLHGLTVAAARREISVFLAECARFDVRCARIIHGKGLRSGREGPVLKGEVATWLSRRADVAAFCSAKPADGGTGAVYVLLRHRKL
jgi:DNA-nicking Smr family endonuclease